MNKVARVYLILSENDDNNPPLSSHKLFFSLEELDALDK